MYTVLWNNVSMCLFILPSVCLGNSLFFLFEPPTFFYTAETISNKWDSLNDLMIKCPLLIKSCTAIQVDWWSCKWGLISQSVQMSACLTVNKHQTQSTRNTGGNFFYCRYLVIKYWTNWNFNLIIVRTVFGIHLLRTKDCWTKLSHFIQKHFNWRQMY